MSSVAGDAITALAKAVLGALGHAVEWASTLWVGMGTPPIADAAGQPTGTVAFLQQNLLVYTTGLAVLCTLLGAGRIAWQEHKAAQMRDLGRYLVTYVLISSAAAGAASVLIGGSDQMASWFISRATGSSNFADHLASLLGLAAAGTSQAAGAPAGFTVGLAGTVTTAFIAIVLGIIAFLATVVQIMLMLVRGGMLVLLVGTLPLVAAFSNTEMGMQWLRKAVRLADRVRAVQAGGGDRLRGRLRPGRTAGRAGSAGRSDDAGARDPRRCPRCCASWFRPRAPSPAGVARAGCSPGRRAVRPRCECRPAPRRSLRPRRARTPKARVAVRRARRSPALGPGRAAQ